MPWAVTGALALPIVLVLLPRMLRRQAAPLAPVRVNAVLGVDASLATIDRGSAAILSPNGQTFAFVAQRRSGAPSLYVRRLDQLEATPLAGTDGAHSPFFSPDGEWIAFFAEAKLKKVALSGGAPVTVCDTPDAKGGAWATDGWIVFAPFTSGGLLRVSSTGGTPTPLTTLADGEVSEGWPQVLPGAPACSTREPAIARTGMRRTSSCSRCRRPLARSSSEVAPTGDIFRAGTSSTSTGNALRRAVRSRTAGRERPAGGCARRGVASNLNGGSAQFGASETGTVVYQIGPSTGAPAAGAPIEWMDRAGRRTPLRATPANWGNPHFSPDGARLAVEINDGKEQDVWVYEWAQDRSSRLTFGAQNQKPVWTPDGRRIVFWSNRDNVQNLYWQRADGTGDVQRLTHSKYPQSAASWHPSGKILAFQETRPQTGADLMVLPLDGDEATGWRPGTPTVFLSSPAIEREPMFSPDGRWLAYQANDTGRFEVYVRPFPGPGGKWLISTDGGTTPTWSPNAPRPRLPHAGQPAHGGGTRCRATRSAQRSRSSGRRVASGREPGSGRSTCIRTGSASPSRRILRQPAGNRIESCSSSTSSTSCAASRR